MCEIKKCERNAYSNIRNTRHSVKKPTGFSGMRVSNMVDRKRTDPIKMLKMRLILCVQTSHSVLKLWLSSCEDVECGQREAQQLLPPVWTTFRLTGRSWHAVCSPRFVPSDSGPIQKLNFIFKGRRIREILTSRKNVTTGLKAVPQIFAAITVSHVWESVCTWKVILSSWCNYSEIFVIKSVREIYVNASCVCIYIYVLHSVTCTTVLTFPWFYHLTNILRQVHTIKLLIT